MSVVNKVDFLNTLSEEELNKGYIKFNIPSEDDISSLNGEGVWGWCEKDAKDKYNDDNCHDKITAILCNSPLEYYGRLHYGDEVVLQCNGECRPTLDVEFVKENLLK